MTAPFAPMCPECGENPVRGDLCGPCRAIETALSPEEAREALEYLRGELRAERISWGELADLRGLAAHIDPSEIMAMLIPRSRAGLN